MRILIVEDSLVTRQIIKDSLSALGECDIVVNGAEAVQVFQMALEKKTLYDLIIMDIKMPVMDGNQALQKIRELEKTAGISPAHEVKVIMMTACEDPKTVFQSYYRGGATSYLVKPFDEPLLLQEVRKLGLCPEFSAA